MRTGTTRPDGDPVDGDPVDEGTVDDGPVDDGPVDDGPVDDAPPAPHRPWWRRHVFEVVVAVVFAVCVLTGTTTSSLGVTDLRVTPDRPVPGVVAGTPRGIRSDEWLTQTPIVLGVIASKRGDPVTPLSQSVGFVYQVPRGGIAESFVFFDGSLLFLPLPDAMLFAANWWLPVLVLGLFMPTWLQRLGALRPLAVLATWLVLLAPVTAWWSLEPVRSMAYTVAAAVAVMSAVSRLERDTGGVRRWVLSGLQVVAAGILLARLPTFYAPWSITLSVSVVLVTLSFLLARPAPRRATLTVLAGTAVATLAFLGGMLWENLDALRAYSATVYPGDRRSTGTALSLHEVFGAPALGRLQDEVPLTGTNASELSSGYTVAAVWAAFLAAGVAVRGQVAARVERPARVAVLVAALCTGLWLAWCTVSWGTPGSHLPILNRVPPERAAETVGVVAVVLVVLVLSRRSFVPGWRIAILAAVVCGGVTLYAASDLRHVTPTGVASVAAAGVGTALAVLLLTRFPRRWWASAVCVVLAASVVVTANPLQRGLGTYRDSAAADTLETAAGQARDGHYLWASNSRFVDALLTATGVPSLSGRQITGPVRSEWARLDPTGRFEADWNRGNSYVEFVWQPGAPLSMANPSPDQIVITVDPCVLAGSTLAVRRLVSSTPISEGCLRGVSSFAFGNQTQYVYAVQA